MKAKEWMALLKEVPEDTEVSVYVGLAFQGDSSQRQIEYSASSAFRYNEDGSEIPIIDIAEIDAYSYMERDTETRTIEWCGEDIEIDLYREYRRYQNQNTYERGFPVDPLLREFFDATPNDLRERLEVFDWSGKPYIVTQRYSPVDASYTEYVDRMLAHPVTSGDIETEEKFNQRLARYKESWFEAFPSGTRYEARCLDGGAWDRSCSRGMFSTLDLAVSACQEI